MSDNEVSADGTISNPPIPAGTMIPNSTEHSSWHFLRLIVKRHPIVTSVVSLVLGTAFATLLGLPLWVAWEFLLIAILILAILGIIVAYRWPKLLTAPESDTADKNANGSTTASEKGVWHYFWALLLAGFVFNLVKPLINQDKHVSGKYPFQIAPRMTASSPLSAIRGTKTATYWQQTIGALHALRFSDPPDNSDESTAAYYQSFLTEFEQALNTAQSASPANVDQDLVTMSQAQLQGDAQLLKMVRELEQMSMESGHLPSKTTLGDIRSQEDQLWDRLMNLTEEEFADLPEEAQKIVISLMKLIETREQQYREIEIMQARMTERYQEQSFQLPEVLSNSK